MHACSRLAAIVVSALLCGSQAARVQNHAASIGRPHVDEPDNDDHEEKLKQGGLSPHEKPTTAPGEDVLATLPAEVREELLAAFPREHVLKMLVDQARELNADKVVTGFTEMWKDVVEHDKNILLRMAQFARHHKGEECSLLPEDMTSHIWRYDADSLGSCLGSGKSEIEGSSGYSWSFTLCHSVDAVNCTLQHNKAAGCCCPMGTHWGKKHGKCVRSPSLKPGETCTVKCAMMPEVETKLTCVAGAQRLDGERLQGDCRLLREETPVETKAGKVLGIVRPVLWRWDLKQYPAWFPDFEDPALEVVRVRTYWHIPFGTQQRFKRPQKAEPWDGVKKLPDYYEEDYVVENCGQENATENCLTLSVYVPPGASRDNPKPVLYWITGDGFRSEDVWNGGYYDGARYAVRQDAILVISNRRSSLLGFWANSAAAEEDPDGLTSNYGLLDERLAMEWINENIENFGGDPSRITMAGHSSGGISAMWHMAAPQSRDLFSSVVLEGTPMETGWYYQDLKQALEFYKTLGEGMGCPGEDAKEQLACLRALPQKNFEEFMNGQMSVVGEDFKTARKTQLAMSGLEFTWSLMGFSGRPGKKAKLGKTDLQMPAGPLYPMLGIGPVVDGSPAGVSENPGHLLDKGLLNKPILIDFAEDEGTVFAGILMASYPWFQFPSTSHASIDVVLQWAFSQVSDATKDQILRLYPHSAASPFSRLSAVIGDAVFKCPARRFARAASKTTGKVWLAETEFIPGSDKWFPSVQERLLQFLGASHIMASMWVFGRNDNPDTWDPSMQGISMLVNCHYAFFLHCHDPDVTSTSQCYKEKIENKATLRSCLDPTINLKEWQPFKSYDSEDEETKYIFQSKPYVAPWGVEETKLCDFWDTVDSKDMTLVKHRCRGCADKDDAPDE
eukprot:TRINITY_DN57469_c0_g1_i1.p1 TRINITY_DN57469_c0_g1~~TRINITY_DN57469_c0_g1_i1.p1  ORF type:complete len:919 (+),score=160.00 TRINITY_DN57469_c0_g1_i1:55-2757(+)